MTPVAKGKVGRWRASVFCWILLATAQGRITTSISFRCFSSDRKSKETKIRNRYQTKVEIQWILFSRNLSHIVPQIASYLLDLSEMLWNIHLMWLGTWFSVLWLHTDSRLHSFPYNAAFLYLDVLVDQQYHIYTYCLLHATSLWIQAGWLWNVSCCCYSVRKRGVRREEYCEEMKAASPSLSLPPVGLSHPVSSHFL